MPSVGISDPLSYFSVWNLIGMCVYTIMRRYIPSRLKPMVTDMVETSMILCSVGGFYFAWIHPGKMYVWYMRLYLDGIVMKIVDLLAHQIPMMMYLCLGGYEPGYEPGVMGLLPIAVYTMIHRANILDYYAITWWDMVWVMVIAVMIRRMM